MINLLHSRDTQNKTTLPIIITKGAKSFDQKKHINFRKCKHKCKQRYLGNRLEFE